LSLQQASIFIPKFSTLYSQAALAGSTSFFCPYAALMNSVSVVAKFNCFLFIFKA